MKLKSPSVMEGVLLAVIASVFASVLFNTLTSIAPIGWVLRLIVAGLGFAYMLYLLRRSPQRIGRVVVFSIWLALAAVIWLLPIPFPLYMLFHIGILWLIRSLYFYASVLTAILDLTLTGFSTLAAVWAMLQSNSVFAAVWCFFLCQALFVVIPKSLRQRADRAADGDASACSIRFESAHQRADAALKILLNTPSKKGDLRYD